MLPNACLFKVQPVSGPLMVRTRMEPIPRPIHDTLHKPPPGHHAVPVSRNWKDLKGPVEFVSTAKLRVEMSHRRGPKPRWSDAEIRKAREDYWLGGELTVADIAERLGTTPQTASNILHGKVYWWA